MKAELRIGNLVTDEFYDNFKNVITVESIGSDGINISAIDDNKPYGMHSAEIDYEYEFKYLRGIPLTEEWLIRFGFEKVDYNHLSFSNGFVGFRWYPLVHRLEMEIEGQVLPLYTHQFVHQLQNLYFALTSQELTLAPPQR